MRILHRTLIIDNLIIDGRTYRRLNYDKEAKGDEYLPLFDEILRVIFFGAETFECKCHDYCEEHYRLLRIIM